MELDPTELTHQQLYKLLAALVIPRPIAWVTTLNESGTVNAAPYSFFNVLSDEPPIMAFGSAARIDGSLKDTSRNIERIGEFVVNIVDEDLLGRMSVSAADFPPEESETDATELEVRGSTAIAPPRIALSPVSFECTHYQTIKLSERSRIVLGIIRVIHVRDGLVDRQTLRLDISKYTPVARLYGENYAKLSSIVQVKPTNYDDIRGQ